ncbi:MFS transporter [uncultured Cohaesibacter sp.]|uniref:MFS transporter n=1 Tax=uncultured Cohaesibacter sp. TaxID=1002546 RepID=UPI00292EFCF0|nr:MFS transporter [uncultured Cohaesibacter sp.]
MAKMLAPIASLLFSVTLLLLGHGLQSTLVPLASRALDFSNFLIGLGASAYFVGFIVGGIVTPHVVVRAGHIRGFAVMVSSMSAAALLHPLVTHAEAWILFRFITGFCISGLYLIIESWLNEFADNSNRGVIMSSYIIVNFAAFTAGQLMVTLAQPEGFYLFAIASIIISVAVMPVAMTKAAQPAPIAIVKLELPKVFRTSPAAIVSAFIVGMVLGTHLAFAPIYAVEKGYDAIKQAPVFAAMLGLGGMITQWPLGRFSDRMDRRIVLLGISILGIFASIAITMLDGASFYLFLLVGVLIGALTQPAYSLAAAHGYDNAKENGYVRMAAGLLVSFGLGSSIGPSATSLIMPYIGADAVFLFPALLLGCLSVYLILRIRYKDPVREAQKEDFDLAATSAALGGVVSPELISEEDRYVVVPDAWEPQEEEPDEAVPSDVTSDVTGKAGVSAETPAAPDKTEALDVSENAATGTGNQEPEGPTGEKEADAAESGRPKDESPSRQKTDPAE